MKEVKFFSPTRIESRSRETKPVFYQLDTLISYLCFISDQLVKSPRFSGQSYLSLPTLTNAYSDLQLSLEFKPESPNGILLLTGETGDMTGDYLTLLIRDGHLELR